MKSFVSSLDRLAVPFTTAVRVLALTVLLLAGVTLAVLATAGSGVAQQPPTNPQKDSPGSADDPTGGARSPICGDQDGSEPPTPPVEQCADYTLLPDLQFLEVTGSGSVPVRFDLVFREGFLESQLEVYVVDDANGSVNGVLPGQSGYAAAVNTRVQTVFPVGSTASTPDVTLSFSAGTKLAFRFRGAFYSYDAANSRDHLIAYLHNTGAWTQLDWDDEWGDLDFQDMSVNVHLATAPPPPPGTDHGQSTGTCAGAGTHANAGSACVHDPVNSLTGAFTTSVTDLRLAGIGVPFSWRRSYTSVDETVGRLGPGWTDSYSTSLGIQPNGDVLLHGDEGQQVVYTKQGDGSFVGADGALSVLTQVTGGYELRRRDQVVYAFDQQGRLNSMKDRNDQGITLAYNGSAQLQTITDSVGRQVAVTFVGGLLSRVTLPDGRYVEYSYTAGRLTSVRDARGGTTQYTYDAGGRLTTIVDQNTHTVVDNVYGADGRVTQQTNARGKTGTFAWNEATQTQTYTDARQNQWKDVYEDGLLVERVDPLGNRARFAYDNDLNVSEITDARGNTTTMTYDTRGNMLTRTAPAPASFQEVWTYNVKNDPLTYRDRRGNVTDFAYDAAGNLTSVTAPDADGPGPLGRPQTQYGHDPGGTGLVTSTTDPRGKQTTFTYANGNLTEIRTPMGNRTTLGYDGSGRPTSVVDPRGNASGANPADFTWTYAYNEADQLRTQTDPLGNVTSLDYDPAGNVNSRIDANNHVTSYAYDNANSLTSVTAPDPDDAGPLAAPVTQYAYDDVSNLASRTDANQHVTSYEYDPANRLTRLTAPLGRVWTYSYDANGNVTQIVDANGNATGAAGDGQTTYSYDVLNRLSSVNYSDATPDVGFQYDGNGNRTQMTDGSGTQTYSYDPLDRLTSVARGANAFSYVYDLANLTQVTYPGGTSVAYARDNDERLQSVTSSGQTTSYGYDEASNVRTTTLPSSNGYVETRTYDRAGRLVDVENKRGATTLSRFAITRDPVGNPLSVAWPGSTLQTYTYDAMDRLTEVCVNEESCIFPETDTYTRWTYDGVGNRLTQERNPGQTISYAYNAADELTQVGPTTNTYDQNGNQLSAGTRTFTYDLANRVKTTTQGSTTTTYLYDGSGKRLQASTGSQASQKTNFLWDVNRALAQLAVERDGNNSAIRTYRYGTRRISQTAGNNTSYYLYDGFGSTANLVSSSGATQWTWSYEPFGSIRSETKASGNQPANVHKFAGEYLDPTGLYHLRARQYDPAAGRFLTRDPVAAPQGMAHASLYPYALDRPTVFIDPSGQSIGDIIGCAGDPLGCTEDVAGGVADATGLTALLEEFDERRDRALTSALGGTPPPMPETDPRCKSAAEKVSGATLVVGGALVVGTSIFLFKRIPPPGSITGEGLTTLLEAEEALHAGRLVPALGFGAGGVLGGVGIWCLQK